MYSAGASLEEGDSFGIGVESAGAESSGSVSGVFGASEVDGPEGVDAGDSGGDES